ncbi:hypothetical protein [Pseudomonas extremaustralis]|uniref:Uncharacterized protein n=1 Tax=Pseudomonas extremaustralis TaxID=359110 RepID=A0A5C5QGS8_9PSED|nr:hypothetical protein [Pseudomonas extremaustralis]EZI30577.1 hypothetical protein PE143B_0101645 [Pseudomonas extremaustralis 14-3 substr. 14-3b]TWS04642.1 hypothetical protein FIV36_11985 [Pseudomonas extremaustralis]SDG31640.1 hypothetical protein SAMN05216591_5642 [Pseudomonas extremaustralis]
MPLPWLIGAAAVAAVTAIVKAVSDDSPSSSSSSSSSSGDAERRKQERAAKHEREQQGLKDRISNLEKDRREQLKAQLNSAAQTLGQPVKTMAPAKTATQLEQAVASTQSSGSAYGDAMKNILRADSAFSAVKSKRFLVQLNVLEALTAPLTTQSLEQQAQAQLRQSAARIKRLQQLKNTVEKMV